MESYDCIELEDTKFLYSSMDQDLSDTPLPKKKKKPSVTSIWAYSSINDLIMAVKEHPCVWEYSCPEYKDRFKREKAWHKIQKKFPGHTVDDCKAKWANIRTVFQNVRKKIKTKSGHGAKEIEPHWPYWTAMQFYNRQSIGESSVSMSTSNAQETHPSCSTSEISFHPETSHTEPPVTQKADILQRAVKCLNAEEDHWHAIGMYLASQMREIAKKNKKAANRLHLQLVKTVMDANLEIDD